MRLRPDKQRLSSTQRRLHGSPCSELSATLYHSVRPQLRLCHHLGSLSRFSFLSLPLSLHAYTGLFTILALRLPKRLHLIHTHTHTHPSTHTSADTHLFIWPPQPQPSLPPSPFPPSPRSTPSSSCCEDGVGRRRRLRPPPARGCALGRPCAAAAHRVRRAARALLRRLCLGLARSGHGRRAHGVHRRREQAEGGSPRRAGQDEGEEERRPLSSAGRSTATTTAQRWGDQTGPA